MELIRPVLIPMAVINVAVKKALSIPEQTKILKEILNLELGIQTQYVYISP